MRTGMLVSYVHEFLLGSYRFGEPTIRDQERLYAAWVEGEEMVLSYHSGHGTHRHLPHIDSQWPATHDVQPPYLRTDRPVEFNAFLNAVEEWREANSYLLPQRTPSLAEVRRP